MELFDTHFVYFGQALLISGLKKLGSGRNGAAVGK